MSLTHGTSNLSKSSRQDHPKLQPVKNDNGRKKADLGKLWYKGPNHAADMMIIRTTNLGTKQILMVRRKSDDMWAFPGGFCDTTSKKGGPMGSPGKGKTESTLNTAKRELFEETSIILPDKTTIKKFGKFGGKGTRRDYRDTKDAWVVTNVYKIDVGPRPFLDDPKPQPEFKNEIAEARFFDLDDVQHMEDIAFDHKKILMKAGYISPLKEHNEWLIPINVLNEEFKIKNTGGKLVTDDVNPDNLEKVRTLTKNFRNLYDIPLIYTADAHTRTDPELDLYPEHCMLGTAGQLIREDTRPSKSLVIDHRAKLDLKEQRRVIRELNKKVPIVMFKNETSIKKGNPSTSSIFRKIKRDAVVYGYLGDICAMDAAIDYKKSNPSRNVYFVEDATAFLKPLEKETALEKLRKKGVEIKNSTDIKSLLQEKSSKKQKQPVFIAVDVQNDFTLKPRSK